MIPAEAVEAAAKAIWNNARIEPWEDAHWYLTEEYRNDARIALEAAAPHMLAEAWEEGHAIGYSDGIDGSGITPNPYRPIK